MMKRNFLVMILAFSFFAFPFSAGAVSYLPDPGSTYDGLPVAFQYDQFVSYSARLLEDWGYIRRSATGTGGLDVVIYTGAGGANNQNLLNNPDLDLENPFAAATGSTSSFSGVWGKGLQPNGPVYVDEIISFLHAAIGPQANTPVFNFDMNQTGSGPSLNVVGQVQIWNPANQSVVASWSFDNIANGAFDPEAWVLSPGTITLEGDSETVYTVDNNKGSGKPDFYVYAPTMDLSLYENMGYWFLADFRMNGLNNGFEELYLSGRLTPNVNHPVPEPGTLLLLGLGMVGLGIFGRRRMK